MATVAHIHAQHHCLRIPDLQAKLNCNQSWDSAVGQSTIGHLYTTEVLSVATGNQLLDVSSSQWRLLLNSLCAYQHFPGMNSCNYGASDPFSGFPEKINFLSHLHTLFLGELAQSLGFMETLADSWSYSWCVPVRNTWGFPHTMLQKRKPQSKLAFYKWQCFLVLHLKNQEFKYKPMMWSFMSLTLDMTKIFSDQYVCGNVIHWTDDCYPLKT